MCRTRIYFCLSVVVVYVRACVRARARACVRAGECECVCVRACVWFFLLFVMDPPVCSRCDELLTTDRSLPFCSDLIEI